MFSQSLHGDVDIETQQWREQMLESKQEILKELDKIEQNFYINALLVSDLFFVVWLLIEQIRYSVVIILLICVKIFMIFFYKKLKKTYQNPSFLKPIKIAVYIIQGLCVEIFWLAFLRYQCEKDYQEKETRISGMVIAVYFVLLMKFLKTNFLRVLTYICAFQIFLGFHEAHYSIGSIYLHLIALTWISILYYKRRVEQYKEDQFNKKFKISKKNSRIQNEGFIQLIEQNIPFPMLICSLVQQDQWTLIIHLTTQFLYQKSSTQCEAQIIHLLKNIYVEKNPQKDSFKGIAQSPTKFPAKAFPSNNNNSGSSNNKGFESNNQSQVINGAAGNSHSNVSFSNNNLPNGSVFIGNGPSNNNNNKKASYSFHSKMSASINLRRSSMLQMEKKMPSLYDLLFWKLSELHKIPFDNPGGTPNHTEKGKYLCIIEDRFYYVKIIEIYWDKKPSLSVFFEDCTEQFQIQELEFQEQRYHDIIMYCINQISTNLTQAISVQAVVDNSVLPRSYLQVWDLLSKNLELSHNLLRTTQDYFLSPVIRQQNSEPDFQHFDVVEEIWRALQPLDYYLIQKNIKITVDFNIQAPVTKQNELLINNDRVKFRRVIQNIMRFLLVNLKDEKVNIKLTQDLIEQEIYQIEISADNYFTDNLSYASMISDDFNEGQEQNHLIFSNEQYIDLFLTRQVAHQLNRSVNHKYRKSSFFHKIENMAVFTFYMTSKQIYHQSMTALKNAQHGGGADLMLIYEVEDEDQILDVENIYIVKAEQYSEGRIQVPKETLRIQELIAWGSSGHSGGPASQNESLKNTNNSLQNLEDKSEIVRENFNYFHLVPFQNINLHLLNQEKFLQKSIKFIKEGHIDIPTNITQELLKQQLNFSKNSQDSIGPSNNNSLSIQKSSVRLSSLEKLTLVNSSYTFLQQDNVYEEHLQQKQKIQQNTQLIMKQRLSQLFGQTLIVCVYEEQENFLRNFLNFFFQDFPNVIIKSFVNTEECLNYLKNPSQTVLAIIVDIDIGKEIGNKLVLEIKKLVWVSKRRFRIISYTSSISSANRESNQRNGANYYLEGILTKKKLFDIMSQIQDELPQIIQDNNL